MQVIIHLGGTGMNRRTIGLSIAFLAAGMAIAFRSSADNPKPGDVTEVRANAAAADGNNWLLNGRTFEAQHFSPLQQINDKNAGGLGLAWSLDIDSAMGLVAEPIVVDGVIYLSAPLSKVYAVDATSGKIIWEFDPKVRLDQAINGSYSARTNAGVAVWGGKVLMQSGTGDCRLWLRLTPHPENKRGRLRSRDPRQTGITGAPHVAKAKRCSLASKAQTTACADRWSPTTRKPARKSGDSGPCREIPREGRKRKR